MKIDGDSPLDPETIAKLLDALYDPDPLKYRRTQREIFGDSGDYRLQNVSSWAWGPDSDSQKKP